MATLNLADIYEAVARAVPDRLALVCGDDRLTYAELDRRANRVARHLLGTGLRAGEHVGLHLPNGAVYVESLLGALKARLVPININYRYTAHELAYLYSDARLAGLVVDAEYAAAAADVAGSTPLRHVTVVGDADLAWPVPHTGYPHGGEDGPLPGERSPDDRFVLYTGGTTGNPKGVIWRQEDFFVSALAGGNPYGEPRRSAEEVAAAAAGTPPMTFLLAAPLMHGAASYNLFMAFCLGAAVVLDRRFDAVRALRLVQDERVMVVTVVGDAMARPLADAVAAHGAEFDLGSWKVLGSGGALLSQSVCDELRALIPDLMVNNGFGASESGMDGRLEVGADGLPRLAAAPNVRVLDESLRPVPPGGVGRIAKSGHVPLGYLGDPVASAATFPVVDGVRWVVLGDLARVEPDGSIVLLGRGSQCINTGGEKVFPEEVEEALKSHPAVLDALVAGVPDERFGERVGAAVE
ncbi:MAG: acyl-CoA synthetase, partial [Jatrophihabitans sp.]